MRKGEGEGLGEGGRREGKGREENRIEKGNGRRIRRRRECTKRREGIRIEKGRGSMIGGVCERIKRGRIQEEGSEKKKKKSGTKMKNKELKI